MIDVSQRLEQWIHEATDPEHPNYRDAELDFQVRKNAELAPLLRKLREDTNNFSTEDMTALIGALNSGGRHKTNIPKNNPLPELRNALLALLVGPGPVVEKIAQAKETIKYAGASILGELYGWAHIEDAPLYNECATDALNYLGYDFSPDDYEAFLEAHEAFKKVYATEVGRLRPDMPLNLEIDKLYNVIDKVDLKAAADVDGPLPTYDRLMNPTIQALKQLGGSGTVDDIYQQVIKLARLTPQQVALLHKPGQNKPTEIEYRLAWSRTYLKKYGILKNTSRGIWTLTELGEQIEQVDVDKVKQYVLSNYKQQNDEDETELVHTEAAFDRRSRDLLREIDLNPTLDFYQSEKDALDIHVQQPFKRVLRGVAGKLPASITQLMETKKRLFSRFPKNDFGQGGAWSHYWGAFFPKGSRRSEDAQLSMWINHEYLECGFYIGNYGSEQRQRFETNCQKNREALKQVLAEVLGDDDLFFGLRDEFEVAEDGTVTHPVGRTWDEFLIDPAAAGFDVSRVITWPELLSVSEADLVEIVYRTHLRLFPLVLLATEDDPMSAIADYFTDLGLEFDDEEDDEDEVVALPTPYTRADFLAHTHLTPTHANEIWELLYDKKQVIFFGPPGTGKSYVAQHLARWITNRADPSPDQVEMIQFHPAYSYEDFIEGIRPVSKPAGEGRYVVDYPAQAGVFRRFCERAARNPDRPHVFIIDEINRGNIPRIFGELMLLLEYRNQSVALPYSGARFTIPPNVYLIATMNTADRSIALVDFALRRRFHFIHFAADPDLFERWLGNHDIPVPYLTELYRRLSQDAIDDANFAIGPSYFMDPDLTETKLARIWRYSIEPYLEEYYVGQPSKVAGWRWDGAQVKALRSDQ